MAKAKTKYVCQSCGFSQVGWSGKCPNCDSWGTLVETVDISNSKNKGNNASNEQLKLPQSLSKIPTKSTRRIPTGFSEVDNFLGGGFVPGQVILLAGEPGIGKSTILLQIAQNLGKALYISAEESASQIKVRANRLGANSKNVLLLEETNIDNVLASAREALKSKTKPKILIMDSIQTVSTGDLSGMAGSIGQVRECAYRLTQFAKANAVPTIIIGHVTKEGSIAGPATLAHLVDTVCWFEGEKDRELRMIRTIKNRFGSTDELGLFKMTDKGLVQIDESENLFTSDLGTQVPGSVATCLIEGSRPVIVEVQALVNSTNMPYPKRIGQGIDPKRIEVILAILSKHAKLPLYDKDVFVNVVGGIKVREPSTDLAIALAIASSYKNKPLSKNTIVIGELGLLGEIRPVIGQGKRIKHVKKHGFKNIVTVDTDKFISKLLNNML